MVPQITPAFLNSVLRSVIGDQATIVNVRREQLTGNRSFNADLWRLHLTYDRPFPTAPQSLIAKLPTVDTELHQRATIFQPGLRENWFYRSGAARSPVPVPRCYHQAIDRSTGQSILLLEDLAPALPGNQLEGATLRQAERALASLARLHASWWADAASPEVRELISLLSDTGAGEHNLVQKLYDAAWPRFVGQNTVPDKVRRFGMALVGNMNVIDGLLEQAPKQCYHDYRYAMCSSFVQGVLSATTLEESATEYGRKLANVIGRRFVTVAQRLRLLEFMSW